MSASQSENHAYHWMIGVIVLIIVFGIYVPHSALRTYGIAAERFIQRAIGSVGWQPNARAYLFHVPFHRQEHALSCEVASLRSALLGIGIDVPESELFDVLPKDHASKSWTPQRGTVWGDPNIGYVGNVDGRMPGTGYGVFAGPLSLVANRYADSRSINVSDSRAIDRALSRGRPIVAWTVLGRSPTIEEWTSPSEIRVQAPIYEHTVVIVGYRGTAQKIEGIYVIDPLTSVRYEPWEEWIWRTGFFNHMGLEIFPDSR